MSVATTRLTIGSVLGTINTAATTVSSTLDAVGAGIGMLNASVTKAATEQRIRHAVDVNEFKSRLVVEVSMERAQRERAVVDFCSDKQNEALFKKAFDELSNIVKDL